MKILPCGDSAVSIRFGEEISPAINARVAAFARAVEEARIDGIVELVPSYCALMARYDPLVLSYKELTDALQKMQPAEAEGFCAAQVVELPVRYGGEYGPDLAFVARHAGLSEEEVIRLHASVDRAAAGHLRRSGCEIRRSDKPSDRAFGWEHHREASVGAAVRARKP
jgi:KipI family sensor histidine kinase inhibitor